MFWRRKNKKAEADELLILFGTRSGNSRLIAKQAESYFRKNGIKACCKNMAKYNPRQLPEVKKLLAVVSTHGEGDPPEQARKFFHTIKENGIGKLTNLQYSVCALGDSSYDQFCRAGKDLDEQLNRMGACAVLPCRECDVDFSKDAVNWIKESYRVFSLGNGHPSSVAEPSEVNDGVTARPHFQARIIEKRKLSGDAAQMPVYHISMEVETDNFSYKPGDSVRIFPKNPEWLVAGIIKRLHIQLNGHDFSERDFQSWLSEKAEITRINAGGVKRYYEIIRQPELQQLIDDKHAFTEYLGQANLLDLLIDYPSDITPGQLKQVVPRLSPRVYSIASGPAQNPSKIDLVVKTIRYRYKNLLHEGAGSVHITSDLQPGSTISFSMEKNPEFRLPKDPDTPLLMIGVGTGIAPFRSFLQERTAKGLKKGTWLIWGSKKQTADSLYRDELESYKATQVLEQMDLVFSRDGQARKYVQDILNDKGEEVISWLSKGAHIYVCGSIAMGKGVGSCLNNLLKNTPFESVEKLQDMSRYHTDVY